MPFDRKNRSTRSGFTLLETMAAFIVLSISLIALIAIVTQSVSRLASSGREYQDASMARAVLEEYVATYPKLPRQGLYQSGWLWQILEKPAQRINSSRFDSDFDLVEVTVSVARIGASSPPYELKTVLARRTSE